MDYDLDAPLPRTYAEGQRPYSSSPVSLSLPVSHSKSSPTLKSQLSNTPLPTPGLDSISDSDSDRDASESERQIRTILRERVFHWTAIVEETPSDQEEDSDSETDEKLKTTDLQPVISAFQQRKREELESERERRRSVRDRLIALLEEPTEQLSIRENRSVGDERSTSEDVTVDLEPTANIATVKVALERVCLPGELFKKQRESVFSALNEAPRRGHLAILLSRGFPANQYCGVYAVDREHGRLTKVAGSVLEPAVLHFRDISDYFQYASGRFQPAKAATTFDAFALK